MCTVTEVIEVNISHYHSVEANVCRENGVDSHCLVSWSVVCFGCSMGQRHFGMDKEDSIIYADHLQPRAICHFRYRITGACTDAVPIL